MGGYGSGRWNYHRKKRIVENCHRFSVMSLAGDDRTFRAGDGYYGSLGSLGMIEWKVKKRSDGALFVQFRYAKDRKIITLDIPLTTTQAFGKMPRWWFLCPSCSRRVGKLYLPKNERYFACRHCHSLSYKSRQEYDKRLAFFKKNPSLLLPGVHAGDWNAIKAALMLE